MPKLTTTICALTSIGLLTLATGCKTTQHSEEEPYSLPSAFSVTGEAERVDDWWTVFEDATLNTLIHEALTNSPDLKTSYYRLKESRAAADQKRGEQFPELSATFSAERNESDSDSSERLALGLTASYETDLWGGIQAQAEAETLRSEATLFDLQAAAVTLSAEVCSTWFALISNAAQVDLLKEQVKSNEQALRLLEKRFGRGTVRSIDVLRQRQLLASTRQQLHTTNSENNILRHQLAVLLGRLPGDAPSAGSALLPDLPSLPNNGLPLDVIRRRPDLQAAHMRIEAANKDTAVALSQRFPRLSLTASASTLDEDMQKLFDEWVTSLAAGIAAPLIDAGQRKAAVRQAEARESQQLYQYGQAVLSALGDIENALTREQHQLAALKQIDLQLKAASRANQQVQLEYLNGSTDFIDVLISRTDTQRLQRDQLGARLNILLTRIGLYRATAGSISLDLEE